jgi:ABC-type transport system involved in multi-copper enzyme maturation permease subunit
MNVWPVIVRELRQQARQKFTFTLRGLGAGLMTIAAVLFALQYSFGPYLGGWLFAGLHITLFYAIWVLVPLSASDCISRERREGTLGLLFLTPLRAREIVLAKALAHGLRAMTLLLAVLPVLTIPFILGGVSWQQAAMSALVNFSAVCWALAAALVASAGTRSSLRALVGAVAFTICAILVHAITLGALTTPGIFFSGNLLGFVDERLLYGMSPMGINQVQAGGGMARGGAGMLLQGAVQGALVAALVLYAAVWYAAWKVRRTWQEEPPSQWVQDVQKTFLTPVLLPGFFKRWMRWKIERNPVGWLEQRTWTGRLVTWAWFAIVISLYSAIFTDRNFFRNFGGMQMTMAWRARSDWESAGPRPWSQAAAPTPRAAATANPQPTMRRRRAGSPDGARARPPAGTPTGAPVSNKCPCVRPWSVVRLHVDSVPPRCRTGATHASEHGRSSSDGPATRSVA